MATNQKQIEIDIQTTDSEGYPTTKPIQWEIVKQLYQKSIIDEAAEPINMPNLCTPADNEILLPSNIKSHMNFLSRVIDIAHFKIRGSGSNVVKYNADIECNLNFTIHASPGSISGWHMESMGYMTIFLMKGNPGDYKLWSIAEIRHLSQERQKAVWEDFGRSGAAWQPPPDVKIMIYELQPNDALLMMPGTIHAPMSPTPCLLSGMIYYHKKLLARSFEVIDFLNRYPDGTNEDLPTQCLDIIPIILNLVQEEPETYGISDLNNFERICSETIARIRKRSKRSI